MYLFGPLGIMFEIHVLYALAALFAGPILHFYRKEWNMSLWQAPGPFIARLTPLYRVHLLWSGGYIDKFDKLHEQYGSVVRTGSNHVITSDPDAVFTIYDAGSRFPKGTASLYGFKITAHGYRATSIESLFSRTMER